MMNLLALYVTFPQNTFYSSRSASENARHVCPSIGRFPQPEQMRAEAAERTRTGFSRQLACARRRPTISLLQLCRKLKRNNERRGKTNLCVMLSCERSRVGVADDGECSAVRSGGYDIASHRGMKLPDLLGRAHLKIFSLLTPNLLSSVGSVECLETLFFFASRRPNVRVSFFAYRVIPQIRSWLVLTAESRRQKANTKRSLISLRSSVSPSPSRGCIRALHSNDSIKVGIFIRYSSLFLDKNNSRMRCSCRKRKRKRVFCSSRRGKKSTK